MSLEGRIRELGLHEVCQLLGLSRKTGRLHIRAPLQGIAAEIVLVHGAITDAAIWSVDGTAAEQGGATSDGHLAVRPPSPPPVAADTRRIESCVLDLLMWTDGDFRFVASDPSASPSSAVRIAIEPVLVEAAQRAEVWERVANRIPNARVIATFVDAEPHQLPSLRLIPQEWEVLTRVDGKRDLAELASVLGRDLLEVVQIVHGLIGSGLLTLRMGAPPPRRHDTPPAGQGAIRPPDASVGEADAPASDLWIPDDGQDALFDPVRTGVTTIDGLPRLRTPLATHVVKRVASRADGPSSEREGRAAAMTGMDAATLCRLGDEAARRGDLAGALAHWSDALRPDAGAGHAGHGVDADRIREAMALAARLHALLHPSMHDAPET